MGNQIVCPSGQEWYESDFEIFNYEIDKSLMDGTFMLCFQVRTPNSKFLHVIKAFRIPNQEYEKIVKLYYDTFSHMTKIPSHQVFGNLISQPILTQYGAYLLRKMIDFPLQERISMEPVLNHIEKLWISFQLILAVRNLHMCGFSHGDIKPENIMISQRLMMTLVDHSPYKPKTIGPNQTHFFIHFFSSRRSCAYIAPERITNEISIDYSGFESDLFSVGCVIAYLFLNGKDLFNFLNIQDPNYCPDLSSIEDKKIRNLISGLISRDKANRILSHNMAMECFPEWFREYYDCFVKYDLSNVSASSIVSSFPEVFPIFQNIKCDGALLYLEVISDSFNKAATPETVILLIKCYVDITIQLNSIELKLHRALPRLLFLFGYKSVTINVKILDGIMSIVDSIKDVPLEYIDYGKRIIIPFLASSIDEHWIESLMCRLPQFAHTLSRIWPSFPDDLFVKHELFSRILLYDLESQHSSEKPNDIVLRRFFDCSIRAASTKSILLFRSLSTIFFNLLSSKNYIDDIISFVESFYSSLDQEFKYGIIENTLMEFSSVLIDYLISGFVTAKIIRSIKWMIELSIISLNQISIIAEVLVSYTTNDKIVMYEITRLLNALPDPYPIFNCAEWYNRTINTANVDMCNPVKHQNLNTKPSRRNFARASFLPAQCGFFKGSKLFPTSISSMTTNSTQTIICHHDNNFLTRVNYESIISEFVCENTKVFPEVFNLIEGIPKTTNILASDSKTFRILDGDLNTVSQSNMPHESMIKVFDSENALLITSEIHLFNIDSHKRIFSAKIGDIKPVCSTIMNETNLVAIGSLNSVTIFDMRIESPVYSFNMKSPISILSLEPNSNIAISTPKTINLYDLRTIKPYLSIDGSQQSMFLNRRKLFVLNENGTFSIDYNEPMNSLCLYDKNVTTYLETSTNNDIVFLPKKYSHSLHGHIHTLTSAIPKGDLVFSSDESGFLNLWSPYLERIAQ